MKRAVKRISRRRNIRGFHVIIVILLLSLGIVGYYRAKVTERFGLKRFTSFIHPYCMEPLINLPVVLDRNQLGVAWDAGADREVGIESHYPADWMVQPGCRAHFCLQSPDFDGANGQVVRISRIDKRLGFPYDHFFNSRPPTDVLKYLLGQSSCSYIRVGELNGIRQIDTTKHKRVVYALEAADASYVLTTENFDENKKADKQLESIVANFAVIPIESGMVGGLEPYNGTPSPQVPYMKLEFGNMDIYGRRQTDDVLVGMRGYTFLAYKGDLINFSLIVPGTINHLSNVLMELYSYGPTVLSRESNLEWRVPVTGRYFLVIKDMSKVGINRPFWLRASIGP